MLIIVPQKYTLFGMEFEFVSIVGTKMWPTCTTKYSQGRIIWLDFKKTLQGGCVFDNLTRDSVDQECSCKEGFIPILKWHVCLRKEREADFNNVLIFPFCGSVLLVSMRT
jgi:hypothetical protein